MLKTNKNAKVLEHECMVIEQKMNHFCFPFHMPELQAGNFLLIECSMFLI